jgi:alpha-tubulin suppressor-like RCC1 family protein
VVGLETVVQVATADTSCAVKQDGTLWCWGGNALGQVGDGTTVDRSSPVQVVALGTSVVSTAISGYRTCAVKRDGTLWCWGLNLLPVFPPDSKPSYSATPVQVAGFADVASVALGAWHYCVIKQDGTVWCWGANGNGALGVGPILPGQTEPFQVTGVGSCVAALAALDHTCAIEKNATLGCWGNNSYGELGMGAADAYSDVPVQATVLGGALVSSVGVGGGFTCVTTTGGALRCWGNNEDGQLGDGTKTNSLTAVNPAIGCP